MERKQQNVPTSVTNLTAQTTKSLYFSRTTKSPNYSTICDTGMMSSELLRCIDIIRNKKAENANNKRFITLSFTSNVISSGLRQCIVDMMPWIKCIVTTTGAIEEDIIKTSWDFQIFDYYNPWSKMENPQKIRNTKHNKQEEINNKDPGSIEDASFCSIEGNILRDNGYNRIGNILVHNSCYISFEQYLLDKMFQIESEYPTTAEFCDFITPVKSLLADIGKKKEDFDEDSDTDTSITIEEKIEKNNNPGTAKQTSSESKNTFTSGNDNKRRNISHDDLLEEDILDNSFLQCAKSQNVPVFISAIGDGSLGDVFTFSKPMRFRGIDGLRDIKEFIEISKDTFGISLGTGVITSKMRFLKKYIMITSNYDDDGASYHNETDQPKIICDLSLVLPIIVKEVFLTH